MHDIHLVLTKLSDYFVDDETEDALLERVSTLQYNINYEVLMNNLIEICTECRQTRESDVFDNTHDSWEYFTRIISIKHLIAFFTGLIELATKDASNYLHQKLAITVCRTYVLLLTSPGAKIFDAFEPPLLQRAFKIVGVLKQLAPFKEHQRVQLQIAIIMLLQDFVLYLKHVSFQNYEDLQTELIDAIAIIMEYHHENGLANKYATEIQALCYDVLEHVCLPLHGSDISTSLKLVLNGTARLHRFKASGANSNVKFKGITDWFIEMLKHYPRQMCKTLQCYIKAVLSDAELMGDKELQAKYLDNCAQYDAAMVRICGESIADYVEQVSHSKDSQHRVNAIELISRMLAIDATCNWELFRHELSRIPREIKLIRILLQKIYDQNNVVSLKGVNAFLKVVADGNKQSKEIIQKCFMNNPIESRPESSPEPEPSPEPETSGTNSNDSSEYWDEEARMKRRLEAKQRRSEPKDYTKCLDYRHLAGEVQQNLLRAIELQFKNNSALIRRAILLLLEFIAKTKLNINHILVCWDFRQLYVDQSPLVRRQLILTLDRILNIQPSNQTVSMAWVKVILDLASDIDQKVMETVIESFKTNIFDQIQNYENSSMLQHVFPWRLLRVMLTSKDCPDFRISMQKWMNKNLLTSKTLAKIETHLDTNNATEAWILLAMVAPNIQGHNPERVSKLLLQNLKYDMTNSAEGCYIQLEVLAFWMKYLNSPSKNEIKRLLTEMLKMGSLKPRNLNRAFGICYKLSAKSGEKEKDEFVNSMNAAAEAYILANQNAIFIPNLCDDRLLSYMYLYSEVASITDRNVNVEIADFALKYLKAISEADKSKFDEDKMLPRKLSCIQSVLTGFASFNLTICARFVPLLGYLLREVDNVDACFTAIKCLGYLCRKNTAVVETVVPYILSKTQHKYPNIREYALNMLATLILEDYLKLRGPLLIYMLASMLDPLREIRELAMELILKYTLEKNEGFMRNGLLECPFLFNGCPCFGQSTVTRPNTENILRGASKISSRNFIYSYLIKKIDETHLYNYFGNISRLAEYIEKSQTLQKSADEQAAIVDFLYICTEICIANAKHKRTVDKIIRDTQNGEKTTGETDADQEMDDAEAAAAADAGVGPSKGSRGRKNQPTMAQALTSVERVIPHIVQSVQLLANINGPLFSPILDKMCTEMCGHFEAMFEYAQPREFWSKYVKMAAKAAASAAPTPKRPSAQSKIADATANRANAAATAAQLSSAPLPECSQNDSGQFTMEDTDDRSADRSMPSDSRSMASPSARPSNRDLRTPSTSAPSPLSRRTPINRRSFCSERLATSDDGKSKKPSGRHTPLHLRTPPARAARSCTASSSRRLIIDSDSDAESVISSVSSNSYVSRLSRNSSKSSAKKVVKPGFKRKRQ